jgi:hypothetical protein
MNQIMEGVTEYAEGLDVKLSVNKGRFVVDATNEGGYSGTDVDLVQLLEWVNKNMPELLPAREWVGLTDEEIETIWKKYKTEFFAIKEVEAKLKEKNT